MRYALLTTALISLLSAVAGPAPAQTADPGPAQIRLHATAALSLAQHWLDWRSHGPENAGICVIGSVQRDSVGAQISDIRAVTRVARLSGCHSERAIGAAILAPSELFDPRQLTELACAAVRQHDDWVIFGIIDGTERKLLETGEVLTVATGLWCMTVQEPSGPTLTALR
jgi:hypothetical protein